MSSRRRSRSTGLSNPPLDYDHLLQLVSLFSIITTTTTTIIIIIVDLVAGITSMLNDKFHYDDDKFHFIFFWMDSYNPLVFNQVKHNIFL